MSKSENGQTMIHATVDKALRDEAEILAQLLGLKIGALVARALRNELDSMDSRGVPPEVKQAFLQIKMAREAMARARKKGSA